MSERRVLRHYVPVDERWHRLEFSGAVVHVASRDVRHVELWTTEDVVVHRVHDGLGRLRSERYGAVDRTVRAHEYRVFGTGWPVEEGVYVGTALAAPDGAGVWHLFERGVSVPELNAEPATGRA